MAFRSPSFGRDTLGRLCRPKDGEPQAMQMGVKPPVTGQQRDLDSNNIFVSISFSFRVFRGSEGFCLLVSFSPLLPQRVAFFRSNE